MLKKLLYFIVLSVSLTATAQVTFSVEGVRGGLNLTNLTRTDYDYRAGFYASGLATLKFTDFYALQFEAGYSQQGARGTEVFTDVDRPDFAGGPDVITTRTYTDPFQHYLTLGAISKFRITPKLYGYAGPSFDFRLASSHNFNNDGDIGLNLGLSYRISNRFSVEVRAKKGTFDVLTDEYDYVEDDKSNHDVFPLYNTNLVFQAGLIYHFTFTDVRNLIKK